MKANRLVKVLVADDHRMVREGIRTMLKGTRSGRTFEVEEAETSEDAVDLAVHGDYQVILMDYNLPGRGGAKATELILKRRPEVAILGISSTGEWMDVDHMKVAGARGYILKNIEPDTLVTAILTVIKGKFFYSNEIAIQMIENPPREKSPDLLAILTPKERDVMTAILSGKKNREIAYDMHVDKRTVDKHREHLMGKLGVRNAIELANIGARLGLLKGF